MKRIMLIMILLGSSIGFTSEYPADYCHANVRVCTDGPGVVAQISSGCASGVYLIGYKKSGKYGHNNFVDAVVNFQFSDYSTVPANFRITPDWQNLGFLTYGINIWSVVGRAGSGPVTHISIAYSNGAGDWDSRNGANYQFPIYNMNAPGCYMVKTNDDYTSTVPFSAWDVISAELAK